MIQWKTVKNPDGSETLYTLCQCCGSPIASERKVVRVAADFLSAYKSGVSRLDLKRSQYIYRYVHFWIFMLIAHSIGIIVVMSTSTARFNPWLVAASWGVTIFLFAFYNTHLAKSTHKISQDEDELKERLLNGFTPKGNHWSDIGTIEESGAKLVFLPEGVTKGEY